MALHTLLGLLVTAALEVSAAPPARIQWTLRFPVVRNHAGAAVGCYGTASYDYVLPTIDELRSHRKSLLAHARAAKLPGFAWSRTPDPRSVDALYVLDLESGRVLTRAKLGFPSSRGIVFCRCRFDDLLNCSRSGVPPLGRLFFSHADDTPPATWAVWRDDKTGLEWHYRWHPACWNRASTACTAEGKRLPTLSELELAQPRLAATALAERVRRHGKPVWSADEAGDRAWAYQLDRNEKSLHGKGDCLTAICIR